VDARNLKSIVEDEFDFIEEMGLVYANAGIYRCALRWHHELIAMLESENSSHRSDDCNVYAHVGYCLYSLGLFQEAIAWSRSCIGITPMEEAICHALIDYESQINGGMIRMVERSGSRVRYTVNSTDPIKSCHINKRLADAFQKYVPFIMLVEVDWINQEADNDKTSPKEFIFKPEYGGGIYQNHKRNLIFSLCALAETLVNNGCINEAKRLLQEAAMLEPEVTFIWERIKNLG
jgi:tetratricopeptide (TPR) repeat protein